MKEVVIIILVVVGLVVGVFFGAASLSFVTKESACKTWTEGTGRNTKFVSDYPWYTDCLVETESGWISAYVLQVVETPNLIKVVK